MRDENFLNGIETHCLITIAGKEDIIDNHDAHFVASRLKNGQILEFPDSAHEILMETNDIRDQFFEGFYALIKKTVIERPETLKPF